MDNADDKLCLPVPLRLWKHTCQASFLMNSELFYEYGEGPRLFSKPEMRSWGLRMRQVLLFRTVSFLCFRAVPTAVSVKCNHQH